MANVERKIDPKFFSSNWMFLNLGVSWLESLGNSFIFVIYNFLDSFELKVNLLIAIMSLIVSDETKEVLSFICNW